MKTITVHENQTIYDIAVEHYGTIEAIEEILTLNPDISNDLQGLELPKDEFYFHLPVTNGSELIIDDESRLIQKNTVKEITEPVTTFELWQEQ